GQTREEVETSIHTAADEGVSVSIAEFSPVPGTPAWEKTLALSSLPLDQEPILHNNSFQPTAWEGLTREDMKEIKHLAWQTRV
ncbi:MAG: B12-binding domain-containing radical SAM protein, partial [Spirochaetota bacterium]